MTIEELKEHCVRQTTAFERFKEIMPVTPIDYKHYEEHKIVLSLIEAWDKVKAEIECLTITTGGEDYIRKMAELFALKIKVLQIIDKHLSEVSE